MSEATDTKINLSAKWEKRFELLDRIEADKYGLRSSEYNANLKGLTPKEQVLLTGSFFAALFGPLFYFAKGMFHKGMLLLSAFLILSVLMETVTDIPFIFIYCWIVVMAFSMVLSNHDYYRLIRCNENVWSWVPAPLKTIKGVAGFAITPWILAFVL